MEDEEDGEEKKEKGDTRREEKRIKGGER